MKKHHLIVGRKPLLEKLTSAAQDIERIYIQKNASGDEVKEIIQIAKSQDIPFYIVPAEKLNSFTKTNHQGIVAICTLIQFYNLQDIIDQIYSKGETPLLLILDNITDVRNVGAIARTAWASGFHAMIIPHKGMPPIQEDAIKVSAGTLTLIPLCRENIAESIKILKLNGIKIFSAVINAESSIKKINFKEPSGIVIGNEQSGIQAYLLKQSHDTFFIPMVRNFDSYNVSVSFGMIAYECMTQRNV